MLAADQIRRRITLGDLRAGQRLESSRVLARELQVSLPVVREALAALNYIGLIDVRHGVGTFVARRRPATRVLRATRRRARRAELHELRSTLAVAAASEAARRRLTDSRLFHLALLFEERSRSIQVGDPAAFTRADLEFHTYVVAAGSGQVHAAVDRLAGSALWTDLVGRARDLALNPELERHHSDLLTAIEKGNGDEASAKAETIASIEAATSG